MSFSLKGGLSRATRLAQLIACCVCALASLASCGTGVADNSAPAATVVADVPEAFQGACGHPGSIVVVTPGTQTIKHEQCDLSGVFLRPALPSTQAESNEVVIDGHAGVQVPPPGGLLANGGGVVVSTDAKSGDVTYTLASEP